MPQYQRNHYVPQWYQKRFIGKGQRLFYLDMQPDTVTTPSGHSYRRNALHRWGPDRCFYLDDLYTTRFESLQSTEIEEKFFGKIDNDGRDAVEYFSSYDHDSVNYEALRAILPYLSVQKLRTPKGLSYLAEVSQLQNKNAVLFKLQELQQMHCALWMECIWSIADASSSVIKFLVTDHPVTVYNKACFPLSGWCRGVHDPGIWLTATHTLFPLSSAKILILTNLSWVRNPYGDPLGKRPNPQLFRPAVFNFTQIQVGRELSEQEVIEINYVLKKRAWRYIAAAEKEWLYPERYLKTQHWDKLGGGYLFMPDPRTLTFSSEIIFGSGDNRFAAFDAYGRRPWNPDYDHQGQHDKEWRSFQAFKGEFARKFGPKHRGRGNQLGEYHHRDGIDSPELHEAHLKAERRHQKRGRRW